MSENTRRQLLILVIGENSDASQILGCLGESDIRPTHICLLFEHDDSPYAYIKDQIKDKYKIEPEIGCFNGSEKE